MDRLGSWGEAGLKIATIGEAQVGIICPVAYATLADLRTWQTQEHAHGLVAMAFPARATVCGTSVSDVCVVLAESGVDGRLCALVGCSVRVAVCTTLSAAALRCAW